MIVAIAAAFSLAPAGATQDKPVPPAKLAKACKKDGNACLAAAKGYSADSSKPANFQKAIDAGTIGCKTHKNVDACLFTGKLMIQTNQPQLIEQGVQLTNLSCTYGALDRCVEANRIYLDANRNATKDYLWIGSINHDANVYRPLKSMCAAGKAAACKTNGDRWAMINRLNKGGAVKSNMLAIQAYRGACDQNDVEACAALVDLYKQNIPKQGVTPDPAAAQAFAAKACSLGSKSLCAGGTGPANVATRGNAIDPTLSYEEQMLVAEMALADGKNAMALDALYRLAKEDRDEANYRLGLIYLGGTNGVAASRVRAEQYLDRSGHPEAAYLLAQLAAQKNDREGYRKYMTKAYFAGHKAAEVWWTKGWELRWKELEAENQRAVAMARENDRQKAAYERYLIDRAMNNYYQPRKTEPTVCGLFRNGGGLERRCMPRKYYVDKYAN